MKHLLTLVFVMTLTACQFQDQPSLDYSNQDEAILVDSLNANFYQIYSADFNAAKEAMKSAIDISTINQWPDKKAESYKNMAVIEYLTGNYEQALSLALQARELYDSIQDWSGVAKTDNELGNFYRKTGRDDKALEMWNEAEKLSLKVNDLTTLGTAYGMKGTFYWLKEQYEISDEYYFKSYDIRVQEQDSVGLGYILVDLADIEQRKGNLNGAISYFEQSNSIREKIGDWQGVVDNNKMIGDMWMKEKNWKSAIVYYQKCAEQSQELGYPDLRRKSLDSLSSANGYLGQFKEALELKLLAIDLKDSLFSAEKTMRIAKLQTQYETAKKEQIIAEQQLTIQQNQLLLGGLGFGLLFLLISGYQLSQKQKLKHQKALETEKRMAKEAQIEASISSQEKERSRFAKDLHDGFGQLISILNLNLKSLEQGDKDKHEVFESSSKVLEEMYQELKGICFNLMPQTLILHGITSALNEFAARINTTDKLYVETDFFGLDERLTDVQEISLYRITQEWINNIIKYSDASKVTIQITKDQEELTLLIEDNGNGFNINSLTSGKGNGWKNMNSRANLINGELEVDSTPGIHGNTLIVNAVITQSVVKDYNTINN
ncbi:tetratricopeptide repeat-containing sensor histidine kinase [Marinoscillum pacificum]|uniref:tetratricopeptide repeat-containing sensor histidine kinase n=1 Tax=Marinoscillum pacificum TaxID=392723 RepID=UPI002157A85A|nr:tetratricopeptide repeat-containing sensor histidine kinase [Marinoscillum pacificum]